MRVVVFIGYLFFLLLGGGHNFYAATSHTATNNNITHKVVLNQQVKYSNKEQSNIVIEYTDVDLEEEHLSGGDDVHDGDTTITFANQYLLTANWYFSISGLTVLNQYYYGGTISPPFQGNRSPIYIKNRVLRI